MYVYTCIYKCQLMYIYMFMVIWICIYICPHMHKTHIFMHVYIWVYSMSCMHIIYVPTVDSWHIVFLYHAQWGRLNMSRQYSKYVYVCIHVSVHYVCIYVRIHVYIFACCAFCCHVSFLVLHGYSTWSRLVYININTYTHTDNWHYSNRQSRIVIFCVICI